VHQPDEEEGRRACQSRTGRADGGRLELLRAGAAMGCEAGEASRPKAVVPTEELRCDDEVAEVLEEALVVCAPKSGIDRLLCPVSANAPARVRGTRHGWGQPYRAGRVDASNGAMALVDAQRLGEAVAYPRLQRRRPPGREVGRAWSARRRG
jgi:hypothetical protein